MGVLLLIGALALLASASAGNAEDVASVAKDFGARLGGKRQSVP